ncbi:MAG: hypothetical protein U0531_01530 [Dehalococcoidia bacterium]
MATEHAVQLYESDEFLVHRVRDFAASTLNQGGALWWSWRPRRTGRSAASG